MNFKGAKSIIGNGPDHISGIGKNSVLIVENLKSLWYRYKLVVNLSPY